MSFGTEISPDGNTLVVRVPLKRRTRGGRRLMVVSEVPAPTGASDKPPPDDPILKALGRAWRWKRLIEAGTSIADLAHAEKVDKSYLCRLLRLTLLSPALTESILDGTVRRDVLLADLVNFSVMDWAQQNSMMIGMA